MRLQFLVFCPVMSGLLACAPRVPDACKSADQLVCELCGETSDVCLRGIEETRASARRGALDHIECSRRLEFTQEAIAGYDDPRSACADASAETDQDVSEETRRMAAKYASSTDD